MSTMQSERRPGFADGPDRTVVSPEEFERLLADLEGPPRPNRRIRKAARLMGRLLRRC